jgi:hypothetical protein
MSLQNFKDNLSKTAYGLTKAEALAQGVCFRCKCAPTFYTAAGVAEYPISGLCEPCFDAVFDAPGIAEEDRDEHIEVHETKWGSDDTNHVPDMPLTREGNEWDARYDFDNIKSERAFADAKLLGYKVVVPEPNQLQIDIDNEQARTVYSKNIDRFQAHIADLKCAAQETPSKSGKPGKSHITLTLDVTHINPEQRILFQLMLGSDPVREFLSYVRWVNGDATPTLFFEKPEQLQLEAGEIYGNS